MLITLMIYINQLYIAPGVKNMSNMTNIGMKAICALSVNHSYKSPMTNIQNHVIAVRGVMIVIMLTKTQTQTNAGVLKRNSYEVVEWIN